MGGGLSATGRPAARARLLGLESAGDVPIRALRAFNLFEGGRNYRGVIAHAKLHVAELCLLALITLQAKAELAAHAQRGSIPQ